VYGTINALLANSLSVAAQVHGAMDKRAGDKNAS
jgi:hypothetical protein